MRCASHGADRIHLSAIQPTDAGALAGDYDRSDGRDGLVTEGEPQAGESIRVVREGGGERYENRHDPCRVDGLVPLARGPWHDPNDARMPQPGQVILHRSLRFPSALLERSPTH